MNYKQYKNTPNLLRKYRKASGLREKDVAKILGLKSSNELTRWENGENIPTIINALKLSILYRVFIEALFMMHARNLREEINNSKEMFFNQNALNEKQIRKTTIRR